MAFSNDRLNDFDDYDKIREGRLNEKERNEQDIEIEIEISALQSIQESISAEIAKYMAKEGIGINELTRRLKTSSKQTSRIINGEANLTLMTLIELAAAMRTKPKIIFEKIP